MKQTAINQAKRKPPAIIAAFIQIISLMIVVSSYVLVYRLMNVELSIAVLVVMQASIAALLSCVFGMAIWWRFIHFGFPIALWGLSSLHISSTVYFWGFAISANLFWTTFRSQVPFYPSRPVIWKQVSELLAKNQPVRMIDIGSGLGDLSMSVAKSRPGSSIYGIEVAPLPWLISYLRSKLTGSSAQFIYGSYEDLNFADYDVIFAYLSPAAMPQLWQKASREMNDASRLISYEFAIPDITPTQTLQSKPGAPFTYIYQIKNL